MIRLQKKQPVLLKDVLTIDFALSLGVDHQNSDNQDRIKALIGLGVQQVVFALDPVSVTDLDGQSAVPSVIQQRDERLAVEVVPSYWLDEALEAFVMSHPLATYQDKYVLLAIRHWDAVRKLKGPLFEIRARGYEPVILHRDPRQYVLMKARTAAYLKDLGCLLQLNLLALVGVYGPQVRNKVEALMKKGYVDVLTTGIRNAADAELLHELQLAPSVASTTQQLMEQNKKYMNVT